MLYGLERFDQYTYGRKVFVQNDHEPLAAILSNPLIRGPKRLQDIMMKLFRYDIELRFVKAVNLILNGWPEDKDRVPNSALQFFDMRDELSVVDGVIVKGEAILIPKCCEPK